jgi:hypothetical protein
VEEESVPERLPKAFAALLTDRRQAADARKRKHVAAAGIVFDSH